MKYLVFKIIYVILHLYWIIFRPISLGARCLVFDKKKKILLVQHNGSNQWYLPGGGLKRKETFHEASIRELEEETGIKISVDHLDIFGCYTSFYQGKRDYITVFKATVDSQIYQEKKCLEIKSSKFFYINKVPENTSPGTMRRIREYQLLESQSGRW